MKHTLEIFFPFDDIFDIELQNHYDIKNGHKNIIKEINNILSNYDICTADYVIKCFGKLEIIPYNSDTYNLYASKTIPETPSYNSLKFTFLIETDINLYKPNYKEDDLSNELDKEIDYSFSVPIELSKAIKKFVFELLILSQIARPGSLIIKEGLVFCDKEHHFNIVPEILDIRSIIIYREIQYPNIEYINFEKFYGWILKNNISFSLENENSFQNTINNLTYIHGENNFTSKFIYLMRALEDLYTDNKDLITEQLNTKIQLFLGPLIEFKRQIKNMYHTRSKFLHGSSREIPFHRLDEIEFLENRNNKKELTRYEAFSFGVLLIIATLQKMHKEELLNLNFKLSLDN